MPKKYNSFTTNIDEIKTHNEKLFEKIDLQIQLHEAFINQQKEVQLSDKNQDSLKQMIQKASFQLHKFHYQEI